MNVTPPLIAPRDTHTLWFNAPNGVGTQNDNATGAQPQHHQNQRSRAYPNAQLTVLQQLEIDEQRLRRRKENIRGFGATWLKPPGVPKTLQAMIDEAQERAEQEKLALHEAQQAEQQAAAEAANRNLQAGTFNFGTDGGDEADVDEELGERDLDDDIPEAIGVTFDDGENGTPHPSDMEDSDDDLIDNEAEEQDLDDDIPEAGSYQHTDTDVEDESTDESSPVVPGATIIQDFNPPLTSAVATADDASVPADSSMLESSPSMSRGAFQRPLPSTAFARPPPRSRIGHRPPPNQPNFGGP